MGQSLPDVQRETLLALAGRNGTSSVTGTNAVVVNCIGYRASTDTVIAGIASDTHDLGLVTGYAGKTVLAGESVFWGGKATSITLTSGSGQALRSQPLVLPSNPVLSPHSKTSANGATIDLDFDVAMFNPTGLHASFVVSVAGSPATVSSVALKGGDATNITVTMAAAITIGQTVTVTIATKIIKSAAGAYFLGATAQAISNITT